MAKAEVRFLSAARREIAEALDWYRERSFEASLVFLEEVERSPESG